MGSCPQILDLEIETNALAYFSEALVTKEKSFLTLAPVMLMTIIPWRFMNNGFLLFSRDINCRPQRQLKW